MKKVPGDGIVPIGCDSTLIEYNLMCDSPDILPITEAAAGIWPWSCDNTIIQYNEVWGHKAPGMHKDSIPTTIAKTPLYNTITVTTITEEWYLYATAGMPEIIAAETSEALFDTTSA